MKYLGYIYLISYALLLGLIGVFTYHIKGMDVQTIVLLRAILAVLFILIVVIAKRDWQTFKVVDCRRTFSIGVAHTGMLLLFTGALMSTSVASTILFFYSATCCSLLFARLYLKEDLSTATAGNLVFCLVGLLLVADPSHVSLESTEMMGNLMAIGAGFSYAGLLIWSKPLSGKVSSSYIPLWQHVIVAAFLLPTAGANIETSILMENALPLVGLGFLCTGVAYLLLTLGVRLVPTQHTLVMTALEPVIAVVVAALLLNETVTLWTSLGAAFIVVGVYRITVATAGETVVETVTGTVTETVTVSRGTLVEAA